MQFTLSLTEALALLGFALSVAVAFASVLWTMWKRIEINQRDAVRNAAELATQLVEYKLHVAQQYASWSQISEIERKWLQETERLYGSMQQLTQRIDRILNRMDNGQGGKT